ncbi:hypothetical protein F4803DRAFT_522366 [Xylaria telfairii]|nr:hypothetical protein F4803DRAFT_522366 [Xylaria telfairii]
MENNVEDNVEASLPLRDLDSKTPLRQHDNAWIRLPIQWLYEGRILLSSLPDSLVVVTQSFTDLLAEVPQHFAQLLVDVAKPPTPILRGHIIFCSLSIVFGVWLGISVGRGNISPVPIAAEPATALTWVIFTGLARPSRFKIVPLYEKLPGGRQGSGMARLPPHLLAYNSRRPWHPSGLE